MNDTTLKVKQLLGSGFNSREIAEKLNMTPEHIRRVKLQLKRGIGSNINQRKYIDDKLTELHDLKGRLKAHISVLEERFCNGLDYVKTEEEIKKLEALLK